MKRAGTSNTEKPEKRLTGDKLGEKKKGPWEKRGEASKKKKRSTVCRKEWRVPRRPGPETMVSDEKVPLQKQKEEKQIHGFFLEIH